MAPKRPAQPAASRGSLSARQWQDLRQAARLARSEGVSLTWRRDGSILIMPAPQVSNKAGNRQRGQQMEQQMAHDPQPMDTQPTETVDSPRPQSKKQQRDAERLQKWKAKQPASQWTARWLLLAKPLLWQVRRTHLDSTFTAWMRSRLEARRKLRSLLWQEWTRPHIPPPSHIGPPGSRLRARSQGLLVLGLRSCRDEYILKRARAFAPHCSGGSREISGWLRQYAAMADSMASSGAATPVSKVRSRMPRGGRGGRSSG